MKNFDEKQKTFLWLILDIVGFVSWNPITLDFLLMEKIAYDY